MIAFGLAVLLTMPQADFKQTQEAWRTARQERLQRPNGWLSVAGLYWVHEGKQTIGSDPKSDIVLPESAPAKVGTISVVDGKVSLQPVEGVVVTVNDGPLKGAFKTDAEGAPDKIKIGDLTISVIIRGKRTGLRMWDPNTKARKEFGGCKWFAPDPTYVVKAKFIPHPAGRKLPILNILGDTELSPNPGLVEFSLNGKKYRLEAIDEDGGLFFNFRDGTSGKETYPAGRFLNTEAPKDGVVELDFNKAVNPPCAFTAFATCPLPPKDNILKVRIPVGELTHHPVHP